MVSVAGEGERVVVRTCNELSKLVGLHKLLHSNSVAVEGSIGQMLKPHPSLPPHESYSFCYVVREEQPCTSGSLHYFSVLKLIFKLKNVAIIVLLNMYEFCHKYIFVTLACPVPTKTEENIKSLELDLQMFCIAICLLKTEPGFSGRVASDFNL